MQASKVDNRFVRFVLLGLITAALLFGETFKLYLKDGDFHVVREYQVDADRVRYYSTERGDWEENPKDLVDLKKTEEQRKQRNEKVVKEARAEDEEEKAERALRKEIESIPMNSGAYYRVGNDIKAVKIADYQVVTDKKRRAIQLLSPVPLVPGKASVVIKGDRSAFVIKDDRPEFYLRLQKEERFGIIRLTPKKNARIVESISIVPVSKENVEERKQIATFDQQMGNGLFKVWPEKTLSPGEYALVEFSETGDNTDIELLIWDFAVTT